MLKDHNANCPEVHTTHPPKGEAIHERHPMRSCQSDAHRKYHDSGVSSLPMTDTTATPITAQQNPQNRARMRMSVAMSYWVK